METPEPDAAPARLRRLPSWLLTHAAMPAQRMVAAAMAAKGARRYHYALLAALAEFGPSSQATLGRRCGIDRSDVVAAINELAGRGLVERTQDPADRRRNVIAVTGAGTQLLEELDGLLADVQDELFAPLSTVERTQLAGLLTRIVDEHGR